MTDIWFVVNVFEREFEPRFYVLFLFVCYKLKVETIITFSAFFEQTEIRFVLETLVTRTLWATESLQYQAKEY